MERRAIQRRRVLKGGSIEFDGRTVECVLRNIFKLNIPHGGIRQNCRVVWRKEALIGLVFEVAA
jgi:hypothetical protein